MLKLSYIWNIIRKSSKISEELGCKIKQADLRIAEEVEGILDGIERLDILVNNAGLQEMVCSMQLSMEDWMMP